MIRRVSWLGIALALSGCGFQLADSAGTGVRLELAAVQLQGGTPAFRQTLRRALRDGGVQVLQGEAGAAMIVHLEGPQERHQVIGVTPDIDAREYEIGMHLSVRLQRPGEAPAVPKTLSRYRHWVYDPDRHLAADEERIILTRELRGELVEALLLHLQASVHQQRQSATNDHG